MRHFFKLAGAGSCLLCLLVLVERDSSSGEAGRVWLGERVLADKIVHAEPIPVPSDVQSSGAEGVAVCSLMIDRHGRVTDVTVLQAPHPALVDTLAQAFHAWAFSPSTVRGKPVPLTGKVVRYLVREGGASRFLAPEEITPEVQARVFPSEKLTEPLLIDVRERSLFARVATPGSVNIPLDELQVRAPVELSPRRGLAIECTRVSKQNCRVARGYLLDEGFDDVELIGAGAACGDCG